jgi:hypothetical protein
MMRTNVDSQHFIAPFVDANTKPKESDWMKVAAGLTSITDGTEETSQERNYLDGERTNAITAISWAYSFAGDFNPDIPVHEYIDSIRLKTTGGRKVWYRVIRSDMKKQWEGHATVSEIKVADGEADDLESLEFKVRYDHIPEESVPGATPAKAAEAKNTTK